MKAIKVSQPFACMICKGLINEAPILLPQEAMSERIYIYATEQVCYSQLPLELEQYISNHLLYGNIDTTESLPSNAVVGYVDVVCNNILNNLMWIAAFGVETCQTLNAHIFDTPIFIPFDVLENTSNLEFADLFPSHTVSCSCSSYSRKTLRVPLRENLFFESAHYNKLVIDVDYRLAQQVLDESHALREINHLDINCGNRLRSYSCQVELVSEIDKNGEQVLYPSVFATYGRDVRLQLIIYYKPLND